MKNLITLSALCVNFALSLSVLFLLAMATGCSSVETRTVWSDKGMRVMLDPDSVEAKDYIRATTAVVQSGKWTVVDRRNAFQAIKKEQEREHRQESDRFDNKEKFAHWQKLYGIGSVIIPYADCRLRENVFSKRRSKVCYLTMTIADANTAEIIASVESEESSSEFDTPDWKRVVDKLCDAYPDAFKQYTESKRLQDYRKESETRAVAEQRKNEVDIGAE